MGKIVNFFKEILIGIWIVVAIFTTACLISSNDYGVSEFGDKSIFVVDNRSLEEYGFDKNDIIITTKGLEKEYNEGDGVFFYYGNKETRSYINFGVIEKVERVEGAQDAFYFANDQVSYDKILGLANGAKVMKKWGFVLGLLESKWGFMFLIILPTLYAVVYEVYTIAIEVKKKSAKELAEVDKES